MKNKKFIKNLSKAALVAAFTFTILGFSNTTAKAADNFNARIVKTKTAHMYSYTNGKFKDTGKTVAISTILKNPTSKSSYWKGSGKDYWVKESDCTNNVSFRDVREASKYMNGDHSPKSTIACDVYYIPTTKGNYTKQRISKDHNLGIEYLATNSSGDKFYVTNKNSYIKMENVDLPSRVVFHALQYLGNPYVYGGNSLTNGIDCSGFTKAIYAHFGYTLNRVSADQVKNGSSVSTSLETLHQGDLVFYKYNGNNISHVAIYIGSGKIIHASDERTGIIIGNLGSPCAAKRIIK